METPEQLCARFGATPYGYMPQTKVGIAQNVTQGIEPINGMRVNPQGDTNGWYIWAGEEMSNDPNFFMPLHVEHLPQWCQYLPQGCPNLMNYLLLPPGWRFLLAPGYEDVWHDPEIQL